LIKSIKDNSGIKFIEHDKLLTSQALLSQPSPPSYGLSRISSRSLSRSRSSSPYIYDSHQGQNIDIYILDSGVNEQHRDFGGRAKLVANFVSNESEEDLFGHGTHVSGIIGGKDYGVAKKSNLYGIKILNKRGEGSVSQALYALAFIIKRVEKNPRRSIINLSLAGDFSEALNQAVDIAYKQLNIAVIVAAGNQNKNACLTSPGSAKGVVAVGNSDDNDRISRTSNYGPCITLFAPGSKIRSASNTDNFGSKILSGTSMAAPHIAGIAALFWSMKPQLNVEQLYTLIQNQATKNVLYNVPMDTPNLLAYNQF
ncbi:subtilisin-like protein, partial [Neoconidiobolus thromboides FSU 785]